MIKAAVKAITPAPLWQIAHRLRQRVTQPSQYLTPGYQGVVTPHNMAALHSGRFGEAFERHRRLDPYNDATGGDRVRMRVYNLCCLAEAAINRAEGDVFTAGVSWGVAQRVLYDYLNLGSSERSLHLVDPFLGVEGAQDQTHIEKYNADLDLVRRQYPSGAKVAFHR